MADKRAPYGIAGLVAGADRPQAISVRGPDGNIVRFPQGTSPATIHQVMTSHYGSKQDRLGLNIDPRFQHKTDASDVAAQMMTFGLTDEAAGVGAAFLNAVKAPFSSNVDFHPIDAYNAGKAKQLKDLADYAREHPVANIAGNVAGAVASVPRGVAKMVMRAPTLVGRMLQGAKAAIPYGAAQGAGNSEGVGGRLIGAGAGAAGAAALGAALPVAGLAVSPIVNRITQRFAKPSTRAVQHIANAMSADAITPAAAGANMDAGLALGAKPMLADQGENLRRLAGSVTRQPGPARAMMTDALSQRMAGQNDRIVNAIDTHLGSTAHVADASDELIARARAAAAPLYDQAYKATVISTPKLDALLNTPAGRGALSRAHTIAANEGRDPAALGFVLDDKGNVVLNPVMNLGADEAGNLTVNQDPLRQRGYTTQTLDYVKRGLDDIVEQHRDPVTRRLNLDEAGRAVNGVRAQFLSEVDKLNPTYAQARAAYAGPAAEKDALNMGQNMVGQPAPQIARATRGLSDTQRAQFELGYRSKLAGNVNKMVDAANRPKALMGSPERRAALQQTFGGQPGLPSFLDTLGHEAAGNETYRVAMQGSPTATNLADDAVTGDSGLGKALFSGLLDLKTGGAYGAVKGIAKPLMSVARSRIGGSGDSVRQGIAALLSEHDPTAFAGALDDLARLQTELGQRRYIRGVGATRAGGSILGGLLVPPPAQGSQ